MLVVQLGKSPLKLGPKAGESIKEQSKNRTNIAIFRMIFALRRLVMASMAGFYFFLVSVYMWMKINYPSDANEQALSSTVLLGGLQDVSRDIDSHDMHDPLDICF